MTLSDIRNQVKSWTVGERVKFVRSMEIAISGNQFFLHSRAEILACCIAYQMIGKSREKCLKFRERITTLYGIPTEDASSLLSVSTYFRREVLSLKFVEINVYKLIVEGL